MNPASISTVARRAFGSFTAASALTMGRRSSIGQPAALAQRAVSKPDAIVIGAGPAGLACAASLSAQGLKALVLEKSGSVGSVWRRHYDRLHLHTDRAHSGLPGMPMPRSYGTYPSRAQVVEYLENYAAHFGIEPVFNIAVTKIAHDGSQWRVETEGKSLTAPVVVVATGWASFPHSPDWPGLDGFRGEVLHSSQYRNPERYQGKRVLVVGFGNSGGEIALDLANAGADTTVAIRGPVQILPRDLLGLPILYWAVAQKMLPARLCDLLNAPLLRVVIGPVHKLGLTLSAKGPVQSMVEDGRVPMLDIGMLKKIGEGSIKVRGALERFTSDGVAFLKAESEKFDVVILATGFRPDLRNLLPEVEGVLNEHGLPLVDGRSTAKPGLYFCGLLLKRTGQLREIGIDAGRIAALARDYLQSRWTAVAAHGDRDVGAMLPAQ